MKNAFGLIIVFGLAAVAYGLLLTDIFAPFGTCAQLDRANRQLSAVRDSLAVERQDLIECYQSRMALEDSLAHLVGWPRFRYEVRDASGKALDRR